MFELPRKFTIDVNCLIYDKWGIYILLGVILIGVEKISKYHLLNTQTFLEIMTYTSKESMQIGQS